MSPAEVDPRDWRLISTYLDQALDIEPEARARWLATLASTEPRIAQALHAVLAERPVVDSDRFLEPSLFGTTVYDALHDAEMTGKQVGSYRLDRLLGRGGMGEVWLASRSDGRFEGQCAIKFLATAVVHPKIVERFQQEAGLLARLGHPHIARLFDAGVTDDGRQFLVLEYVDGLHIDEYCEQHRLSLRARLRLFLDAVAAVAHAHSHLIIHRDLKPSNVLVTRDGTVKLLDFGVAKLLSRDDGTTQGVTTRVEEIMVTPEYAAPEQLLGDVPSTATDVYQLGMLLHELLTGRHPLESAGSRAERIRAALNGNLPPASEFAASPMRKQLRGDVDAILAKALQGAPEQRYPTAAALRDDLLRHLNREPVSARCGAGLYGFSRFMARHRAASAVTLLAIVALCGTLVFAVAQARMAAHERDHALALASRNAAVTEFLGTLITDAAAGEKPVTVTEMLARSEKLALADSSGSPENRAAVLAMIGARYGALDDRATAARLFENGLALLEHSKDQKLRTELNCLRASAIAGLGQTGAAVRAIEHELGHLRADPEIAAYCLLYRAFIASEAHDAEPTLKYAKEALQRFRAAPQVAAADEGLFLGAVGLGYHLNGLNREADGYFRRAMQKYTALGREASANASTVRNNWALMISGAGAPKQALELYDRELRLIAERDPGETPAPVTFGNRGRALESIGRFQEARAAYLAEVSTADLQHNLVGQAHGLLGLASIAVLLHDDSGAAQYLRRTTTLLTPVSPEAPPWRAVAIVQGRMDLDGGRFEAARRQFSRAIGNSHSGSGVIALLGKAESELRAGDAVAAAQDARLALDTARAMQGNLPYSNLTGLALLALGHAEQRLGHGSQAQDAFRRAELQLTNTVDADHPALVEVRGLLAGDRDARA